MKKQQTALERLKRMVEGIEKGDFELVEYEAVALRSEPGRYVLNVILKRPKAYKLVNPTKRMLRQTKTRELIFADEDDDDGL